MSKICPKCAFPLNDDAAFCIQCGAPQIVRPTATFCPNCGSRTEPGALYCAVCGQMLNAVGSQENAAIPSSHMPMRDEEPTRLLNNEASAASDESPYAAYGSNPGAQSAPEPTTVIYPERTARPDTPLSEPAADVFSQPEAKPEAPATATPEPDTTALPKAPESEPPTVAVPGFASSTPDSGDTKTVLLDNNLPQQIPAQDDPSRTLAADMPDWQPAPDVGQAPPAWQTMQAKDRISAAEKPKKAKKSKKKWIFIGVGAGVVAVLAVVFFVFILPLFGKSADSNNIIFKNGGDKYYASPYVMRMDGDNLSQVMYTNEDGKEKVAYIVDDFSVQVGDTIYYLDRSRYSEDSYESLKKMTFPSKDKAEVTPWVTLPVSNTALTPKDSSISPNAWTMAMRHFASDGKYVYFNLIPDMEHLALWGNIAGKVGRISLEGNVIEQFSDINAADLVIDGDWIYYFDTGYNPDGESFSDKIDASRAGIYKIKTDGSGKELLHAVKLREDLTSMGQFSVSTSACGKMQMIGDWIYFLDYTEAGMGRVARMAKSGGNVEYVTNQAANSYAVDTDHEAVYYYVGSSTERGVSADMLRNDPVLCKCDMKTKTEIEIPFIEYEMGEIAYSDGYLYFTSYRFKYDSSKGAQVGLRMNVETLDAQWVNGYREKDSGWRTNPETGRKEHYNNISDPDPKWIPVNEDEKK